eukprot:GILK01002033.1.p1 GENE.GILK01002033.1~~GILK01002033.1.p1  ORF type:complete len:705 (+),score=94.32 GILK01002033.1:72-2186(+)
MEIVTIAVIVLCLPLFLFFVYATLSGLGLMVKGIFNQEIKKNLLYSFSVGFILWMMFMYFNSVLVPISSADVLQSLRSLAWKMSFRTVKRTAATARLSALDKASASVFSFSHTTVLIMGVMVAMFIQSVLEFRKRSRPSSFPTFVRFYMINNFFTGSYLWFRFCLPYLLQFPFWHNLVGMTHELYTHSDVVVLTLSHFIAFFIGMVLHDDHTRRNLHKKEEKEILRHYSVRGAIITIVPQFSAILGNFFGFDLMFNFVLRATCLLPVLVPFNYAGWFLGHCSAGILTSIFMLYEKNDPSNSTPFAQFLVLSAEYGMLTWAVFAFIALCAALYTQWFTFHRKAQLSDGLKKPLERTQRERAKAFPREYPNGWYKAVDCDELQPGDVKHVEILGMSLAVFREETDEQRVRVLDAYCPHLGANMAVNGTVQGDGVVCPFHGWKFRGSDGKCTEIAYCENIPEVAKTRSFPTVEMHGQVYFWYHRDCEAPTYFPHPIKPIEDGSAVYHGKWSTDVTMHIQDFAENSPDFAHFNYLHSQFNFPILGRFIKIHHVPGWEVGEGDRAHLLHFKNHACLRFKHNLKDIPNTNAVATVTFIGCGGIVYFHFQTQIGDIYLVENFSPKEPMLLRNEKTYWADKSVPRVLVKYIVNNYISAFQDDMSIWNHKTYIHKPILVKGDGPIGALRRWYSQFYCSTPPKNPSTHACSVDW